MEEDAPRLLADILARLAPRGLAVSRSVCKEWRATVDARCHQLLPISLGGIFIWTNASEIPDFFVRPSMAQKIAFGLDYYQTMGCYPDIGDCCNGLLLLEHHHVVNPATRQWAQLPPCPPLPEEAGGISRAYLLFDPTLSPHYKVLSMNGPCRKDRLSPEGLKWPPSVYMLHIYSSTTGRWEERPFARKGPTNSLVR
nr:unnamed protein product [Digitaria exilis]